MEEKTIGYARTSTAMQDMGAQIETLKAAGCSVVYIDEAVSGSGLNRPGLKEARANICRGDTLKVVSTDRISRNRSDLDTFVTDLLRNHIAFESVEEPDAPMLIAVQHALNYRPVIPATTPLWRNLLYRFGAFLIRVSGLGSVPPR